MPDSVNEIVLGSEALNYIEKCLANGKSLARYLSQRSDLPDGRITTYLPSDASMGRINHFESGILPEPPLETHVLVRARDGSVSRLVPVPNVYHILTSFVSDFLGKRSDHVCIFEERDLVPTDPAFQLLNMQASIRGDEIYYLLLSTDANDMDKIGVTIRRAKSWLFIGAMTSISRRATIHRRALTIRQEALGTLASRAERIVVGAYDLEGFLVWTRP